MTREVASRVHSLPATYLTPLPQVKFHFPEPTELVPPLIQLMDVSFQYPGRDDFGLQVASLLRACPPGCLRAQSTAWAIWLHML